MLKWLGKMFASDKVVEGSLSLIDKAFYTDEEEARDKQIATEHKSKLLIDWIDASKGSNIARRFIAFLVAGIWAFLFLFSWVSGQIAIWTGNLTTEKLNLMNEANAPYLDQATGAMMLVLAFYFAAPYMGNIVNSAINRFSGENKKENN